MIRIPQKTPPGAASSWYAAINGSEEDLYAYCKKFRAFAKQVLFGLRCVRNEK